MKGSSLILSGAAAIAAVAIAWFGWRLFCVSDIYVPFKATLTETGTCDVGDAAKQTDLDYVIIENATDNSVFMIESIVFEPDGLDELHEGLLVRSALIDGRVYQVPVTDSLISINGGAVDMLGGETLTTGGSVMRRIVSDGSSTSQPDVKLSFSCQAQATGSIVFPPGGIVISGWKRSGDTITIRYSETGT